MPYVCYVDEAGCATPLPSNRTDIQPVLVVAGLIIDQSKIPDLTVEFLRLKRKYFPGKFTSSHLLDDVREEIKGSDLRSRVRNSRHKAKAELRFLDDVLALLKAQDGAIFASIWIKGVGKPFRARPVYTRSMQLACHTFQQYLEERSETGFIVADFRTVQLNDQVAHSIFTQKYRAKGDPFPRVMELPTFGVSNNHVGLQIADLICSTLLFPMATSTFCWGHIRGVHVRTTDQFIKRRFMTRIKGLQYRYMKEGQPLGGVWVRDGIANRSSQAMFFLPSTGPQPPAAKSPAVVVGGG